MKGEGAGWLLGGAVLWLLLWAEEPGCLRQIGFFALFLAAWITTWKGLAKVFPGIDDPMYSFWKKEEKRRAKGEALKQSANDLPPGNLPSSGKR